MKLAHWVSEVRGLWTRGLCRFKFSHKTTIYINSLSILVATAPIGKMGERVRMHVTRGCPLWALLTQPCAQQWQAHGVIMVVALAILVPMSVGIAHSMRGSWGPRLWFQLHRAMGVRAPPLQRRDHSLDCTSTRNLHLMWRTNARDAKVCSLKVVPSHYANLCSPRHARDA